MNNVKCNIKRIHCGWKLGANSWKVSQILIPTMQQRSYLYIDPSCDVMESCLAVCCNIDDISPWNESNWHARNQNTTQGPETNHWYFNEMSGSRCLRDIRDRCHDVTMSRCHEPGARLITFSFGVIQTHFPIPISASARAAGIMPPLGACALSPARQAVIKVLCRGKHWLELEMSRSK